MNESIRMLGVIVLVLASVLVVTAPRSMDWWVLIFALVIGGAVLTIAADEADRGVA